VDFRYRPIHPERGTDGEEKEFVEYEELKAVTQMGFAMIDPELALQQLVAKEGTNAILICKIIPTRHECPDARLHVFTILRSKSKYFLKN
jgi:hypothetical protein